MSRYLNETGRHIVYSCEWPMYESAQGGKVTGNFRYFRNHNFNNVVHCSFNFF